MLGVEDETRRKCLVYPFYWECLTRKTLTGLMPYFVKNIIFFLIVFPYPDSYVLWDFKWCKIITFKLPNLLIVTGPVDLVYKNSWCICSWNQPFNSSIPVVILIRINTPTKYMVSVLFVFRFLFENNDDEYKS